MLLWMTSEAMRGMAKEEEKNILYQLSAIYTGVESCVSSFI